MFQKRINLVVGVRLCRMSTGWADLIILCNELAKGVNMNNQLKNEHDLVLPPTALMGNEILYLFYGCFIFTYLFDLLKVATQKW